MLLLQLVVVDPVDDHEVGAVGRRGDQHALGAGLEMRRGFFAGGEDAGAFQRDIDVQVLPRQRGRIFDGGNLHGAAAGIDGVAGDGHFVRKPAVHGIVAQQVRIGFDRSEVVGGHHLDVGAARFDDRAQDVAPDPPEAVDCDPYCHFQSSPTESQASVFNRSSAARAACSAVISNFL